MRVTKTLALSALLAACTVAQADWIAAQKTLADMSKANTSALTKKNATVLAVSGTGATGVATVKFNANLASIGQTFTAAQDWSAYNIVDLYITNRSTKQATFKFITQYSSNPDDYTNAFTGEFTVYAGTSRNFVCFLNKDNPLPYGMKYLNPVLSADAC